MTLQTLEDSILLDNIIDTFRGDVVKNLLEIKNMLYGNKEIDNAYYRIQNLLNRLKADDIIEKVENGFKVSSNGYSILSDIKNYGYVAKYNESKEMAKDAKLANKYARIGLIVSIVVLIIGAISLVIEIIKLLKKE